MSLKSGNYNTFVFATRSRFDAVEGALSVIKGDLSGSVVDLSGLQGEFQDLSGQVIDLENLTFTGAGLEDVSAGSSSGSFARINLNGTFYKLDLLDDT